MDGSGTATGMNCHVLVLNQHYMAIRVIDVKRAITLLFKKLAEVVTFEEGRYSNYDFDSWLEVSEFKQTFAPRDHDWLHTVRLSIAVPRIVRLLGYDRLPRQEVTLNRRNLYARDHSRCQYCGKHFATSELSIDHIIPRSRGGQTTWNNVVCACLSCNVKKGNRTPQEAGLKLFAPPLKPRRSPIININLGDRRYESWKQFLDHAYWSVELK